MVKTKLQVALDVTDLGRALKLAILADKGGADIIEAGTPLIKYNGVLSLRLLKNVVEDKIVLADLKTLDAGKVEAEMAFSTGADIISISALADEKTLLDALETARSYGGKVCVDFLGAEDFLGTLHKVSKVDPDYILIHIGLDQQARGTSLEDTLSASAKHIPNEKLAVAGGISIKNILNVIRFHPAIIVVGGAFYKAPDPEGVVKSLKKVINDYYQSP